uniref:Uncharacterized protein n=1 Tax=Lactuca sativa TaxID=4236 RepID=A0A9R1XT07_LACSA|nr:hypothetical protein LSAT_V11C200054640 [Lactuca sativa]
MGIQEEVHNSRYEEEVHNLGIQDEVHDSRYPELITRVHGKRKTTASLYSFVLDFSFSPTLFVFASDSNRYFHRWEEEDGGPLLPYPITYISTVGAQQKP